MSGRRSLRERERAGVALAALAIGALYVAHARWIGFIGDDAYISFQYVRNLLRGNGLVYNVGERVEGYTNFLWILLLGAVTSIARHADIAMIATVLGLSLGLAAMALLLVIGARHHPTHPWLILTAPLLLACQTPFSAWSTGGLESTLFAFCVLLGVFVQERELRAGRGAALTALVALLVALTRADGFVIVACLGAWRLYESYRRGESPVSRANLLWGVLVVGGFGAYLLWRHAYYGEWLPNTSYAKVGFTVDQIKRGISFSRRFWNDSGGALFLLAVAIPFVKRDHQPGWRGAVFVAAGWTGYIVVVGGDGLAFLRFFAFIAPLICLLAQEGVIALAEGLEAAGELISRPRARIAVAVVIFWLAGAGAQQTIDLYRHPIEAFAPYRTADSYFLAKCRVAGEWLAQHTSRDAVVASTPAGAVAYFSDRRVIDMLGLNDYHIARVPVTTMGTGRAGHERGDGAYVLQRRPDYILMGNVTVGPDPAISRDEMEKSIRLRSEHELWALPGFHEEYEMLTVPTGAPAPFLYFTFYRRKGTHF